MKSKLILLALVLLSGLGLEAQILFTEGLTMSIDSGKRLQGTISPSIDFKTEGDNILTFDNEANLSLLMGKKHILNLINKFELTMHGKQILLSGGHIHAEYRYLLDRKVEIFPFAEAQWAASRGLLTRAAAGLQSRYQLLHRPSLVSFASVGLFFEHEEWEDSDAPNPYIGVSNRAKTHIALSLKHRIKNYIELTLTGIHQAMIGRDFWHPRYGLAADLTLKISKHINLRGTYRCIYDTKPIIDIRKDYTTLESCLDLSF